MDWIKFPLVQLTLFYTIGIAIANGLEVSNNQIGITGLGMFLIAFGIHAWTKKTTRKPILFNFFIFGVFVLFGIYNFNQHLPIPLENSSKQRQRDTPFYVQEVLKETDFYARYYGVQLKNNSKILIRIKKDSTCSPLQLGQYYLTNSIPEFIPGPKNPYEFNYAAYLYYQGINAQIKASASQVIALQATKTNLRIKAGKFRERLQSKLNSVIKNQNNAAVLQALLLGEKSGINPEIRSTFSNAGIMHILAISGLHLGIIMVLVNRSTQWLKRRVLGRIVSGVILLAVLWSFAFITGLSASVVRAAVMFSFFALAQTLGRNNNSMNTLFVSFLLLLLYNPLYLFQVGFKMSYAAVFFILWVHPLLKKQYVPKTKIGRHIWEILSVSLVAQWGVLPLSLYYFNVFPVYFLLANVLILPFIAPILSTGLALLCANLLVPVPTFCFTILETAIHVVTQLANWIGSFPAATISDIKINDWQLWLLYILSIGLVLVLQHKRHYSLRYLAISTVLFASLVFYIKQKRPRERMWLLNRIGQSTIAQKNKDTLILYNSAVNNQTYYVNNLKTGIRARSVAEQTLPDYFIINNCKVLVVKQAIAIPTKITDLDYLILTSNCKIHFEAWIKHLKPKTIIADGSNYGQTIERWQATAKKEKLLFYATTQQGAFKLY